MEAAIALKFVEGIASQLGTCSVPLFRFLCCFEDEKTKLKRSLDAVKAWLLDAEEQQYRSYFNQDSIEKLQLILYEADDLVEEIILYEKADVQTRSTICSFFKTTIPYRILMPFKLKAISDRLAEFKSDRAGLPSPPQRSTRENKETRKEPVSCIPDHFIGREKDKEAIKNMIEHGEVKASNVPTVIAITGMGGLGKTTLARSVYDDARALGFDLEVWVWVSQDFDVNNLVKKVIQAVTKQKCKLTEMMSLESKLRECLHMKKYLLVLDDMWIDNHISWDEFGNLLKRTRTGARGSVILATTRETNVASTIGAALEYQYPLKDLEGDDCLSLFEQQLGFKLHQMEEEHISLGKEILKKCGGIPLAIMTVAGLLSDPDSDWQSINNDELWSRAQEDNYILPSLRVSYSRLPSNLKKCFAYCSLFPKGDEIEKAMLTQMWLAQGFTQQSSNKGLLVDSGDECFKKLMNRSFLQEVQTSDWRGVTLCKMHDLMHDLAKAVAGSAYVTVTEAIDNSDKIIHASIRGSVRSDGILPTNSRNLRTLLTAPVGFHSVSKQDLSKITSSFKRLRVLDVSDCEPMDIVGPFFDMFVSNNMCALNKSSIENMKHVRYLNLSWQPIRMLPDSMCELRYLQTLKLNHCFHLKKLPGKIKKLVSLTHLENEECSKLKGMPVGIGQLTSIQTLSLYILGGKGSGGLSELENLNNLKGGLRIQNLYNARNATSKSTKTLEKKRLQSLSLEWKTHEDDRERMHEGYRDEDVALLESLQPSPYLKELSIHGYSGVKFPSWIGKSLLNLVEIRLFECPNCECLSLFVDQLPHLKLLSLESLPKLEYIHSYVSNVLSGAAAMFPALERVHLCNLSKLKEWHREVKSHSVATAVVAEPKQLLSLETLSTLTILGCPELKSMPLLPNVEQLKLRNSSGAVIESMTMAETTPTTSSLPSLLTHSKLKSIYIRLCRDLVSLPQGWLENLTSLEELFIGDCAKLTSLSSETHHLLKDLKETTPTTSSLPSLLTRSNLKSIRIENCSALVSLPQGWLENLTSLEELYICDCAELVSLSPETPHVLKDLKDSSEDDDLQSFTRLRELSLVYIPKLTSLPKGLQYATNLKKLVINRCDGLVRWLDSMGNITSLHWLEIEGLQTLPSLPQALRHLTALETLEIQDCPELNFSDDDNDTPIPTNLHSLILWSLPKLTFLPDSLKVLTSLQDLRIHNCKELKSLPETMSRLTALHRLHISECPQLPETHQRDNISPNIAHIPEIWIY